METALYPSPYLARIDALLIQQYGIVLEDTDADKAAQAEEEGQSPEEFVAAIAEKYELIRIDR